MKTQTEMTTREAFRIAKKEPANPHGFMSKEEQAEWDAAEKVLLEKGYCSHCAAEGDRIRLMDWQPGNYREWAGRECPQCEAFFKCGDQPEYELDTWMGDADPGL